MNALELALVISELIDDDVRVLALPEGDESFADIAVESLDGKKRYVVSVIDFSGALDETKGR